MRLEKLIEAFFDGRSVELADIEMCVGFGGAQGREILCYLLNACWILLRGRGGGMCL